MFIELRSTDRIRKLQERIDAAIQRINDGSYGYCVSTGEEIGLARLEVRPIATMCIKAQEEHERFEKDHSDEV
jgi:DnaK suppressor protein